MGSKRKKAEKQKDFVKPKLKVGKTAAKAANHTDTSFVSKAISLPNQSISKKSSGSKDSEQGIVDRLSLTKHHSSHTRKEVLHYIEQHLPSNPALYNQILGSVTPLILDRAPEVRDALVSFLRACAEKQQGLVELHMQSLVLFIHSSMTHIQPDIRISSSRFLKILVETSPDALIKSYFIKTMRNFFTLMSWTLKADSKSLSLAASTSSSLGEKSRKARAFHIAVLRQLLEAALFESERHSRMHIDISSIVQVHPQSYKYLMPSTAKPFASLKLFVQELPVQKLALHSNSSSDVDDGTFRLQDLDIISTDDLDTRRKVMSDVFLQPMMKNLKDLVKEGGEVGREANSCIDTLKRFQSVNSSGDDK